MHFIPCLQVLNEWNLSQKGAETDLIKKGKTFSGVDVHESPDEVRERMTKRAQQAKQLASNYSI